MNPNHILYRLELRFWQIVTPLMLRSTLVRSLAALVTTHLARASWPRFWRNTLLAAAACYLIGLALGSLLG